MMSSDNANGNSDDNNQSLWNSIQTWWTGIMDEERLDRLHQCRLLEDIYGECQRSNLEFDPDRVHLEDIPIGIRQVRFFDWRDNHDFDRTCQREEHAIWACRAISLKCGTELADLKSCFDNLSSRGGLNTKNPSTVLSRTETAYANPNAPDDLPCRSLQQKLGQCVSKNSKELLERQAVRSDKGKK
jgi:hypothetical protein